MRGELAEIENVGGSPSDVQGIYLHPLSHCGRQLTSTQFTWKIIPDLTHIQILLKISLNKFFILSSIVEPFIL